MPFSIIRADITAVHADAIVNTVSPEAGIGSGVDAAIHQKAGPQLAAARYRLGYLACGQAKATSAFALDARYVIHTAAPLWQGGDCGEEALLRQCYTAALETALACGCESVAFPLLGAGNLGFPGETALACAIGSFRRFLAEHELHIILTVFPQEVFVLSQRLTDAVESCISEADVQEKLRREYGTAPSRFAGRSSFFGTNAAAPNMLHSKESRPKRPPKRRSKELCESSRSDAPDKEDLFCCESMSAPSAAPISEAKFPAAQTDWDALLRHVDAGFSETLLHLIDASGKSDPEIYKKANIDRKLFSKIRSNPDYRPAKTTALALAFALELDYDQTQDLIGRAGYTLTRSSRFDLIVEYFLRSGWYDLFELNTVLFAHDQPLLGA